MNIDRFRVSDAEAQKFLNLPPEKPASVRTHQRPRKKQRRRPYTVLPIDWVAKATNLRGKASAVAIACWYAYGLAKNPTVQMTPRFRDPLGLSGKAFRRGLTSLAKAGMILIVDQRKSISPTITILFEEQADAE